MLRLERLVGWHEWEPNRPQNAVNTDGCKVGQVGRLARGGCAARWARLEGGKVGGREGGDQRWEGWKVGLGKEKNDS